MPVVPSQRTARIAGVWFILTFVFSIAGVLLYHPVLHDTHYIVGSGADTQVSLGAVCELLLVVANIASALVLFPILKQQNETLALGYVAARIMESAFIIVGILCLLTVVKLRNEHAGADATSLVAVGKSLVATRDWTFVLGPGFVVGIGNGLTLGYLMYRSGLVPRGMAMLGLVGGPLVSLSGLAVVLGAIDRGSAVQGVATIPEILWEASLGIYLVVKGFKSPASEAPRIAPDRTGLRPAVAG